MSVVTQQPATETDEAPAASTPIDAVPFDPPEVRPPALRDLIVNIDLQSRLIPLQSWEGVVESVDWRAGTFWARLEDLNDPSDATDEAAEFLISEVDSDDHELLRVGGVFRWIIGFRQQNYGKRERISSLVFRRLPSWTAIDLKEAEARGLELADAFHWS